MCAIGKAAKAAGIPAPIVKRLPNCFIAGTQVWKLGPPAPPELVMANSDDVVPTDPLARAVILASAGTLTAAALDQRRRDRRRQLARQELFRSDAWEAEDEEKMMEFQDSEHDSRPA